jgi:hypothetical protein
MNQLSMERMKRYIVENNTHILNKEIKLTILNLVMMEVGPSVIMETNKKEVDINLDLLQERNAEVLKHIYNIIKKRVDTLNQPAKLTIKEMC